MTVVRCVVDNRVFLLGLDALYRAAIKPHERGELLECARTVAEFWADERWTTQRYRHDRPPITPEAGT